MIITGMAHFESVAKKKLVEWYHKKQTGSRNRLEQRVCCLDVQDSAELQVPCIHHDQR